MANNFITNNTPETSLKARIKKLISVSDEMKFLVGFFYFSGWKELYTALQKNENQQIKILVGLQVCNYLGNIIEYSDTNPCSQEKEIQKYLNSLGCALNTDEFDTKQFYEQVHFFINQIEQNKLIIRKTLNPNHAKLYLFHYEKEKAELDNIPGVIITGSSNLTRAGLLGQNEFNIEIKDYGYETADAYFEELWEDAIRITEDDWNRKILIDFINNKTQLATITPFEAYCLVIKTYLDTLNFKTDTVDFNAILKKIGYKKLSYQVDAVQQALQIIEEHNGCIIADVVGLGKSVIASMIARQLNRRGLIICPPGLIGDENSGWEEYRHKFGLYNWEVHSKGKLENLAKVIDQKEVEVVIVDEAHYFRNQDTDDYEYLSIICRGKKVILLTATPFNNSPADIFSLLKLFIIPGKSSISLEDDLAGKFRSLNYEYKGLSDIYKNWNSADIKKQERAERNYENYINEPLPIDIKKVKQRTELLSQRIKQLISPVVIRRNRLDLKEDYIYSKEIGDLSEVQNPKEIYYYLTPEQSHFYDKVVSVYFAREGQFTGAIYQPFAYDKGISERDDLGMEENRKFNQQQNLYHFMRRLLVKRFESSFGAFQRTIERFIDNHTMVRDFIKRTGKHILDRKLIENIQNYDLEDIDKVLEEYSQEEIEGSINKVNEVYHISQFDKKEKFEKDVNRDIAVFESILKELKDLNLADNDPKQEAIIKEIKEALKRDPNRKIILFSEYVDTIKHLENRFREEFGEKVLVCDGILSNTFRKILSREFDAQFKGVKTNQYQILLTSDKLSEGFNLNRAGLVINYDIPWNPTRVIQRVGRINRIGTKVFDKLYIYNFFPSEVGATYVKSREIAEQKMFLIHNALGEDAKIFDEDEEPTPSELRSRLNKVSDDGEVNLITRMRNLYAQIEKEHPKVINKISNLPSRVKSTKNYTEYQLNLLRRKGLSLFAQSSTNDIKAEIEEISFEELLERVRCSIDEPPISLSSYFWENYKRIKEYEPKYRRGPKENTLENKAMSNIKVALKTSRVGDSSLREFLLTLQEDLKEYQTLPKRSIRRLAEAKLTLKSSKHEVDIFLEQIRWLKSVLGKDYLTKIKSLLDHKDKEVIIAIENYNDSEIF